MLQRNVTVRRSYSAITGSCDCANNCLLALECSFSHPLLWAGWKTWAALVSEKAQRELLVQASLSAQWNARTLFERGDRAQSESTNWAVL